MKRTFLIAISSIVLLNGCQRTETTTTATETASTMPSASTAEAPYDLQFIDSLTKHHQMAVDMARMGQPKFEHQELKDAAQKMIDDQTSEIAQLRQWRDQWYPGAPDATNMQMPGMSSTNMDMSHMQSMSGRALDVMFIDMMIPHHEGAIAMGQDALARAGHQEIKDLSQQMIEKQKKEIDQMREWKKAWTE